MKVEKIEIKRRSFNQNWVIKVDDNIIKVTNKVSIARLFVNDEVQDSSPEPFSVQLSGKLPDGREIKVRVGGFWALHCCIFVDNKMVLDD